MEELKIPLEIPYRKVVIDYLNLVFSDTEVIISTYPIFFFFQFSLTKSPFPPSFRNPKLIGKQKSKKI